ncbi:MAG: Ig-like domain-containing protein, partial [Candidatus Methanomethylophilaceae archaeon]|nr:Ig-like domain-containing protein [Candidatus Methanomethylophilaceae archaeon]
SKEVLSFCENVKEKLPEGMILSGSLEIDDETADYVEKKLITPVNITNIVPESVIASQESDVTGVKAVAEYSDGSQCQKVVDWDLSTVDFEKEGEYRVTGKVHKEHFPFPIFENRADPCIGRWNGKYYFIATTDEDGNHSLSSTSGRLRCSAGVR